MKTVYKLKLCSWSVLLRHLTQTVCLNEVCLINRPQEEFISSGLVTATKSTKFEAFPENIPKKNKGSRIFLGEMSSNCLGLCIMLRKS